MEPPVKYVALFSQVSQMNVTGKSFKTFTGEATQVFIRPESSQIAMPEPLCGNSVSQFHQDILLMHFTDHAFCRSKEVGLVNEWLKHERVNPSRGFEPALFDQLNNAWASILPRSAEAENGYDFLARAKFPGYVSG
jgi:hypothetical protein